MARKLCIRPTDQFVQDRNSICETARELFNYSNSSPPHDRNSQILMHTRLDMKFVTVLDGSFLFISFFSLFFSQHQ